MKILNLYAGIGGNRMLWGNEHDITAIEINENIAKIYKEFFPNDKIIITDAHEYLLNHYKEYDFIWASPPCPSHSDIRRCGVHKGQYDAIYPDMTLYQEIILLKHFTLKKTKWVIENVKPYYQYLIDPNIILGRHPFWCNFFIEIKNFKDDRIHQNITGNEKIYGFSIKKMEINNKRQILRNLVNLEIGLYILNEAMNKKDLKEKYLFD